MSRVTLAAVSATAALLLAACGGNTATEDASDGPELPDAASSESSEPKEEDSGPERNDRGNIVKALGEEGGLTGADGEPVLTFAVDAITPDVQCTEDFASPAENGHLTAVQVRAATTPGVTAEDLGYMTINAYDWAFVGADGITFSNVDTIATYGCLNQSVLFPQDQLRPGSQYAGTILLDLPAASGALIYTPSSVMDGTGWEWSF